MQRRSENQTGRGWGIAALVVIAAIVINAYAAYIHFTTSSRHPTDPMYRGARSSSASPEAPGVPPAGTATH